MLDNFFGDEEKTGSDRDSILQRDTENIMEWACKKRGILKENLN